jgi:hypothetical protein
MTFTLLERIAGGIGRRYWLKRIDAALHGAYREHLIDSWTLHAIDAKAKYHNDPASRYDTDRRAPCAKDAP